MRCFPEYVQYAPALEPEPQARVLRAGASDPSSSLRSLDSEMDDTLSLPELPCEPEHPSVSLGCRAFPARAEVYQVGRTVIRVLEFYYCARYVKCWNVYTRYQVFVNL